LIPLDRNAGSVATAQRVDPKRSVSRTATSAPKERDQQTQDDADDDAGDDREIKAAVLTLDPNVTWQAAEPFRGEPTPQNEPEDDNDHADDHEKFANVMHAVRRLR
jgi:hypothetical protein